jgi:outer membrane receptor protein involved in Fe transport
MFATLPAARRGTRSYLYVLILSGLAGLPPSLPAQAAETGQPLQVAAAAGDGAIEGAVVDSGGKPLATALVQLVNEGDKVVARTQSDLHGRFSFSGVAAGTYSVNAAKSGDTASAEVQVSEGGTSRAQLTLGKQELQTVTVTAKRFERARNALSPSTGSSQYVFSEKTIEQLPEGDHTSFNHVLLQAPGVANDSFGQVHVRGDHADLQYRINGIILPDGVSGFGQVFDPRFAKSITLNTGALPAEYGLRTAGVIDIVTKDHLDGGDVDLYGGSHDTLNPSVQLGKTYGNFTSYVTGQFLSSNLGVENPTGSSSPIHDWTSQGKGFGYFSYLLDSQTRLSAIVAATGTRLEIPNNPNQPVDCDFVNQLNGSGACNAAAAPDSASVGSSFISSAGLNERQYERNQYDIVALQGIGDVAYQLAVYNRISSVQFVPDAVGDLAFNGAASEIKRKASAVGLQGDLSYPLGDAHRLSVGFSASDENDRSDNTSVVFTTTNPSATGAPCPAGSNLSADGSTCYGGPETIVDNNPKNGNSLISLYAQDKWDVTSSLVVNYGLRYDHLNAYTSGGQLSPRIGLLDYLTPRTTIHAGYARYFTPPPTELISNGSVTKFENTTLSPPAGVPNDPVQPERSHYFDAGFVHQLTPSYNFGLDSYYRYARNLIDEGQFGTALIFTPFNYQQGHVYGVEFTNNYHSGHFSGYFNLARSVAQATNVISAQAFGFASDELAYISNHYVLLDHDQLWTASAGASYVLHGTTFGAEGTYGDGLRQGFANTGKLPPSVQLDLSISHDVDLGERFGDLGLRLAAINVLDRINEIRDGTGIGVGAPQFGPRAAIYFGVSKSFTL